MKTTLSIGKLAVAALLLCSNSRAFGPLDFYASPTVAEVTRPQEADRSLRASVRVNGISAAVSSSGKLLTSSNGTDWTEVRLPFRTFLRGLTVANGLCVVVGGSYVDVPGVILSSRDGMTWTRRRSPTKSNLYGIAFGNGTYVAVGDNSTVLTSPDGVTWKRRVAAASEVLLSSLAFGNGTFVALGDSDTVLTSTDAVHWLTRNSATAANLSGRRY
jgi:photosystem II stability/assembly factor-like uncharacterized protein